MSAIGKILNKAKGFIDKNFIEPSRRVKRGNARTNAINKAKAKSGAFNKVGGDSAAPTY